MLNRVFAVAVAGILLPSLSVAFKNGQCEHPEELSFNFRNIDIKSAFALLADFAKYRAVIDASITGSEPMTFVCRRWDDVARDLAERHHLRVEIRQGAMYVSKK
jgi:hypothetical protein